MALFCYLGVLCVVPLILNKDDAYVDFHIRQGLVLWIWGVLSIFSLHIPAMGPFLFSFSFFVILMLAGFGVISVFLGKAWRLPMVGFLAKKL